MNFQEKLTEYMTQLHCTARELSDASGLSTATLSRYRSGARRPAADSEHLKQLSSGIAALAESRNVETLTQEQVYAELQALLSEEGDAADFSAQLDLLIRSLHINIARMARSMSYDASFISKIRRGQRSPANISVFSSRLISFIADNYPDDASRQILAELMNCEPEEIAGRADLAQHLGDWLLANRFVPQNTRPETSSFLVKLDAFNLEDYIRVIHFNEINVPVLPDPFPEFGSFTGTGGRKKAELLFLANVVRSESKEPLFMYSDMAMEKMSEDKEFSKNWMSGLALVLKKEQPITVIHNLNRPFHELMLGLEAYIPLYMTGLVSPYYLNGAPSNIFRHFLNVAGTCALSGEAVADFQEKSRFFLTQEPDLVAYYRERANLLLKKASPLMDIYTLENRAQLDRFAQKSYEEPGDRHIISSVLPLFTLPPEKLEEILRSAGISGEAYTAALDCARKQRAAMEYMTQKIHILDELPLISREEYANHPLSLSFADAFCPPVPYSYEDYALHLEYTKTFSAEHPAYQIKLCPDFAFRNIRIHILQGRWVWISKVASPTIHFVIFQPQLREAIENMYIAVTD